MSLLLNVGTRRNTAIPCGTGETLKNPVKSVELRQTPVKPGETRKPDVTCGPRGHCLDLCFILIVLEIFLLLIVKVIDIFDC